MRCFPFINMNQHSNLTAPIIKVKGFDGNVLNLDRNGKRMNK